MATTAARNDNAKSKDRQGEPKLYQPPTLVKAAKLSAVTARVSPGQWPYAAV